MEKKYFALMKLSAVQNFAATQLETAEDLEQFNFYVNKIKHFIFIEETKPWDVLTSDNVYIPSLDLIEHFGRDFHRKMECEVITCHEEMRWLAEVIYTPAVKPVSSTFYPVEHENEIVPGSTITVKQNSPLKGRQIKIKYMANSVFTILEEVDGSRVIVLGNDGVEYCFDFTDVKLLK